MEAGSVQRVPESPAAAPVLLFQGLERRTRERGVGPRALMVAVLKDAILAARYNSRQAERWIRSEDWEWPFSFNNICVALNFDRQQLRDAIFRARAA